MTWLPQIREKALIRTLIEEIEPQFNDENECETRNKSKLEALSGVFGLSSV